jgi:murein DD-endopeptidase MepM/ murein hydrolase activator NlpD
MPEGEASNWRGLLSQVAGYLARPRQGTPLREVDLASKQLEAELRRDANVYGAFSARLADAVAEQQGALAVRAEEIRRAQKRAAERNPTFQWPLERIRITSLFGRRLHPLLGKVRRHDGVDLAAGRGSPIHASASGTVLRAGRDGGYGILVELLHKDGSRTRYAHLMRALVRVGDVVDGGDVLGQVGSTGLSTGPHLHFELWRKGRARNPLRILGAPRSAKAGAERGSSPSVPVRRTTASS